METHPLDIPQRLQEIDPELRVLFDTDRQDYTVWGLGRSGPYILARFRELDCRVLNAVRYGYWLARNTGAPYTALLRQQAQEDYEAERRRQRGLADLERAFREDMRGLFRKLWPGWRAA
ncbi:hypothetical protein HPY42_06465 [Coprothermobacteraceae bacterium]|nr:hypothetical protein [Coprothermobacteraceae bacterium]